MPSWRFRSDSKLGLGHLRTFLRYSAVFITAEKGGVARAKGVEEKKKEGTTECTSQRRLDAQYVSWVHQLPDPALRAGGQDLTQQDLWTAPNLIAHRDRRARLLQD